MNGGGIPKREKKTIDSNRKGGNIREPFRYCEKGGLGQRREKLDGGRVIIIILREEIFEKTEGGGALNKSPFVISTSCP